MELGIWFEIKVWVILGILDTFKATFTLVKTIENFQSSSSKAMVKSQNQMQHDTMHVKIFVSTIVCSLACLQLLEVDSINGTDTHYLFFHQVVSSICALLD